jgi:hypothetical protein
MSGTARPAVQRTVPEMGKIPNEWLEDVVEFHLNGSCCGVKSEVTLTDPKAEVRFCPICGADGKQEVA